MIRKNPSSLLTLLLLSTTCFLCCHQTIELDPNWPLETSITQEAPPTEFPTDESTQPEDSASPLDTQEPAPPESLEAQNSDVTTDTLPEQSAKDTTIPDPNVTPDPPKLPDAAWPPEMTIPEVQTQCNFASAAQLSLLAGLSSKGITMLLGNLGNQAASQKIYIRVPTGWYAYPPTLEANPNGEFAFLLKTSGALQGTEQVLIFTQSWCYSFASLKMGENPPSKLEPPNQLTCTVGQTMNVSIPLKGNPKSGVVVYSTMPSLVTVLLSQTNKSEVVLRLECKQRGNASLLLGNQEFDATSLPVIVQ